MTTKFKKEQTENNFDISLFGTIKIRKVSFFFLQSSI